METDPDVPATQAQVSAILESITTGFFALDADWRFTYVNKRAEAILGRAREELLGKLMWQEFPKAWDSRFGHEYRRAREERCRREFEAYATSLNRWFEVHVHPSEDGLSVYFSDVTERRRAEDALRKSELRYRALFDNAMDAVLLLTADGRVRMANRACADMFGYGEAELRTMDPSAMLVPSDPRLQAALEERRRTGRFRGELTLRRKDGTQFPAELSTATFRDEGGTEWTSMAIHDISRRKAVEVERERLIAERDAERLWLHAVLEHLPLGAILFTPDGKVQINPRAEALLGVKASPEGGSAQYASRILFPDGSPVPPEQLVSARVLRTGATVLGAEYVIERPDGSRLPILGSAAAIRDSQGKPIGGIGIFQDMSERMRTEEEIRSRERLLSAIFELLPVGLWLADRDGRFVRTNAAGRRIWCAPHPREAGERLALKATWADTGQPVAPEDRPLLRALHGEASIAKLLRVEFPDGAARFILTSAVPLWDERHALAGAIVVDEDLTELKHSEDALRRALRARDELLGIVAHDLRNPLNALTLHLAALRHRAASVQPELLDSVNVIGRQAQRMNHLIQDLLDVARIDAGSLSLERSRVAPARFLAEHLDSQRPLAAASGVALRLELRADLPEVGADPDRLAQVLENLVGNAIKFTPRGGQITVGALSRGLDVLFWVRDTGEGVSEEHLPHLFDRYWQASRTDKRGAGLGLAIVKGIVETQGGHVWAESHLGEGTTLFFTVPVADVAGLAQGETSPALPH